MHVNYAAMPKEQAQAKIWDAMRHLAFTVELCLNQVREGRFYAFEHPISAMSWATGMVEILLNSKGSQKVAFDFCMLGMKANDENGQPGHAKKRTGVLTNSSHLIAMLQKAQCNKGHKHVQLTGGRAKACEVYPPPFCDVICRAARMELDDEKWLDRVY